MVQAANATRPSARCSAPVPATEGQGAAEKIPALWEPARVRLEWISAAEGEKVKRVINEMVDQVQALGPLGLPQKQQAWDKEISALENEIHSRETAAAPA